MYDYLKPLLKKKPAHVILHIGSNDSPFKPAEKIVDEILNLKIYIEKVLPSSNVYISSPTIRYDNKKANLVLKEVTDMLTSLPIFESTIVNDNINREGVGKKGLHLNAKGSTRLALNYISLMRCL